LSAGVIRIESQLYYSSQV